MDTHIHKHNDTVLLPHHDAVNIRRLYLPTFASQNDDIQKKTNTTSNSHYMRENSPCILFLYYTISGYSWNQNINANASPTRDTALGHSLTKGGLICKMNKIVIWPHRNCDVTGKTPCLLHVLRLKLCTYTPLYK